MYIYIYIYVYVCVYIYIYIHLRGELLVGIRPPVPPAEEVAHGHEALLAHEDGAHRAVGLEVLIISSFSLYCLRTVVSTIIDMYTMFACGIQN